MLRNQLKTHGLRFFVFLATFALGTGLTIFSMNFPECETLNVTPPLTAPKPPPTGTGHYCSVRCHVHGTPLENGWARIVYGVLEDNPHYDEARLTLFPNTNSWVARGCVLGEETQRSVRYCPDCRKAEMLWLSPPPPPPPLPRESAKSR